MVGYTDFAMTARNFPKRLGLIAGNGKFPILILAAARAHGAEVVVAAIKEETFPEIEQHGATSIHWMSLGELSKLVETFHREGITEAIMAGQVKHKQIFSAIRPDWKLAKLLADEGITLLDSTSLLEPLLAQEGVLSRRPPTDQEQTNITYGRAVAQHLSRFDIGQTVVIAEAACVAVEAMEGTDATILRAGELLSSPSLGDKPSTLGRELTVVKVAKPNQDMRFDVPVIGLRTIETMKQANATCLALDAGKCLLLDGSAIVDAANAAGICMVAEKPATQ